MFGAVLAPYLRIGLVPENAEVATDRRSLYPSRPGGTYPGGDVHDDTGRVDDFVGSRSFSSSSQWRMSSSSPSPRHEGGMDLTDAAIIRA
jgi:hypothetical protein